MTRSKANSSPMQEMMYLKDSSVSETPMDRMMWSLQSSQPGFFRTLILVYILMATRRVVIVKHTACVTMSHEALEGGSIKLDVNPGGAGMAEKLPLSHHGRSYLSSRAIKIMFAAGMWNKQSMV